MISGLVLFAVMIVGSGFLTAGKDGVLNVGATLGNPARARFAAREENGRTIFSTTPARTPWTSLVINGGMLLGAFLIFAAMADFKAPGSVIAAIFLGLVGILLFMPVFKAGKTRKPAEIIVDANALSADGKTWRSRDIADILIRNASNLKLPEIVANAPGQSTSGMMGRAAARRLVARSYVVAIRLRTGSDEEIIAGGLTLEAAEALAEDIVQLLGKPGSD
ncbi:MAG: hypothetical protein Kow00133_12480 [Amphiplicatus sp.]